MDKSQQMILNYTWREWVHTTISCLYESEKTLFRLNHKNTIIMNNDEANNESSPEEALKQILDLTIELYVNQKKSKQEVISILQELGLEEETARNILKAVCSRFRKDLTSFILKETFKGIGKGLIFVVIGIAITAITYSMAEDGGTYIVTVGLFICGGLLILTSLIYLITNLLKTIRYM